MRAVGTPQAASLNHYQILSATVGEHHRAGCGHQLTATRWSGRHGSVAASCVVIAISCDQDAAQLSGVSLDAGASLAERCC